MNVLILYPHSFIYIPSLILSLENKYIFIDEITISIPYLYFIITSFI